MGTYVQGVESIIPSLQPYESGLNVVSNLLQLKQSQYDTNYAQLGKMYGQYYYGDLTREDNIKKRDNTVKQIDFDLKRIAGLDLSQEKNVQQAGQIFKSFYEDSNLMKDMAWTKNFNKELGEAQGLLKSDDQKVRDTHWEDGIKELLYRKEEFKNADANTAMSISSPVYTPYVNIDKKIQELAKDADLSFEKTSMSDDGMWIIKNKNGEILKEPLSKLFEAQLSSDPSVQAVYKTQAYVNRKNTAYGDADKYGGVEQAEMKYLETAYTGMRDRVANRQKNIQEISGTYDARIKDIQKQIKEKGSNPLLEKTLKEYQDGKGVNDTILSKLDSQLDDLNGAYSSSGNTSTGDFHNPYQDIDQLRRVVDGNVANDLMSEDIFTSAETYAYKDAKEDFKENPYAVLDIKHKQQLSEINAAGSWRYKTEQLRGQNAINKRAADAYYDEFNYSGDKKPITSGKKGDGKKDETVDNAVPQQWTWDPNKTPAQNIKEGQEISKNNEKKGVSGTPFTSVQTKGGNLADQNQASLVKGKAETVYNNSVKDGLLQSLDLLIEAKKKGNVTGDQIYEMFAPDKIKAKNNPFTIGGVDPQAEWKKKYDPNYDKGTVLDQTVYSDPVKLKEMIQQQGVDFLIARTNLGRGNESSTEAKHNYLGKVIKNVNSWTGQNSNLAEVQQAVEVKGLTTKMANAYFVSANIQDFKDWRFKAKTAIVNDMYNSMKGQADIITDFGTPVFNKEGKFVEYNMDNLKFQLDKSFDEAGNFNKDYKPYTNYEEKINEFEYKQGKVWNGTTYVTPVNGQPQSILGAGSVLTNKDFEQIGTGSYPLNEKLAEIGDPYRYTSTSNTPGFGANRYNPDPGSSANVLSKIAPFGSDYLVPTSISAVQNKFINQFYNSAMDIYGNKYDTNILNKAVPGFDNVSGGYGVGSMGLNALVDLSKPNSQETFAFMTWADDWNKIKSKINGADRRMSFEDLGSTGWENGKGEDGDIGDVNKKGVALMNKFMTWALENNTEANAFNMTAAPYANDNMANAGMKFMFPEKFLKAELIDADKNPNGSLNKEDYDLLSVNGLSVIGLQGDFNNVLMNSNTTPFQAHVDYRGEYTWKHPSGLGEYNVRKGGKDEPDYVTSVKLYDYDGKEIASGINNVTRFGGNIDASFDNAVKYINSYAYTELAKTTKQQENIQNK